MIVDVRIILGWTWNDVFLVIVAPANDCAMILKQMNVDNHIAELMVELSRSQDYEIGDGRSLGTHACHVIRALCDCGVPVL
ncbi:hypothetical protein SASPL_110987 [Salvia splendens]|uniref:Uncharacterized protein n=1 Tax=Salvia splendens TaxID=180675 RepID=A0A8X8Y875_SALSN|nr:hypothetical protein SASPL_110987 [Salvia splendens]